MRELGMGVLGVRVGQSSSHGGGLEAERSYACVSELFPLSVFVLSRAQGCRLFLPHSGRFFLPSFVLSENALEDTQVCFTLISRRFSVTSS